MTANTQDSLRHGLSSAHAGHQVSMRPTVNKCHRVKRAVMCIAFPQVIS